MTQVSTLYRLARRMSASMWAEDEDGAQGLSRDGKLLFALLLLTLLGPYLPILRLATVVGIEVPDGLDGARLDNLAIPAVAIYLVARSVICSRVIVPLHAIFYLAFLIWIGLMTVVWWTNVPSEYADSSARGVGLLRSMDGYGRPLLVLLIATNARVTRNDFAALIKLILIIGVILGVVAAAQLLEATSGVTNRLMFDYYDNNPGEHFWAVLNQGRAASLMPQLSTLGMYAVLAFGLLAAQLMGGRTISSPLAYGILAGGVFLAGQMSGSKVFVGGLGLLVFGLILLYRTYSREALNKLLVGLVAIAFVWLVSLVVFNEQAVRVIGLAVPQPPSVVISVDDTDTKEEIDEADSTIMPTDGKIAEPESSVLESLFDRYIERYYVAYLQSRFEYRAGKVYRTGAMDIARDYPVTGLGLNVANRTTDSMALGIFIMGGVIGSTIYFAMLVTIIIKLRRVVTGISDPDLVAMARVLIILTIAFLLMSTAFHTFIQDRAGDAYWLLIGLLIGPLSMGNHANLDSEQLIREEDSETV